MNILINKNKKKIKTLFYIKTKILNITGNLSKNKLNCQLTLGGGPEGFEICVFSVADDEGRFRRLWASENIVKKIKKSLMKVHL